MLRGGGEGGSEKKNERERERGMEGIEREKRRAVEREGIGELRERGHRETGRQTGRQAGRQADRQRPQRQTDRQTETQRDTERLRQRCTYTFASHMVAPLGWERDAHKGINQGHHHLTLSSSLGLFSSLKEVSLTLLQVTAKHCTTRLWSVARSA